MRHPAESDACFMIEVVDVIVPSQSSLIDPSEASLVQNAKEELSEEVKKYMKWWTPSNRTKGCIESL